MVKRPRRRRRKGKRQRFVREVTYLERWHSLPWEDLRKTQSVSCVGNLTLTPSPTIWDRLTQVKTPYTAFCLFIRYHFDPSFFSKLQTDPSFFILALLCFFLLLGCGRYAGGQGYNSIGHFCGGWAGNCGDGGIGGSTWYLVCDRCREKYLREKQTAAREKVMVQNFVFPQNCLFLLLKLESGSICLFLPG